jgi:hypothetical protein
MKTVKNLPAGSYMKANAVQSYFQSVNLKSTLASIINITCPVYEGEYDVYYDTQDLKNVINPGLFRELECEVITHIIMSEDSVMSTRNDQSRGPNYDTSATAMCSFMTAQDEQKTSSPIHPIFEQALKPFGILG